MSTASRAIVPRSNRDAAPLFSILLKAAAKCARFRGNVLKLYRGLEMIVIRNYFSANVMLRQHLLFVMPLVASQALSRDLCSQYFNCRCDTSSVWLWPRPSTTNVAVHWYSSRRPRRLVKICLLSIYKRAICHSTKIRVTRIVKKIVVGALLYPNGMNVYLNSTRRVGNPVLLVLFLYIMFGRYFEMTLRARHIWPHTASQCTHSFLRWNRYHVP